MIVLLSLSLLPLVTSQMCEHANKTFNTDEHYVANCQQCTCHGGQWDCSYYNTGNCQQQQQQQQTTDALSSQEAEYSCEKNQKRYKTGEKMTGDCETCTCYGGQWDCSFYDTGNCENSEYICEKDQQRYKDGQKMIDACETCTCHGGQWDCLTYYQNDACKELRQQQQQQKQQHQVTDAPSSQEAEYSCEKNQKRYKTGEKMTGDCETCTCYGSQWDCSFYDTGNCEKPSAKDLMTCRHGQKAYANEEQFVENCEQCTCSKGEWSCRRYDGKECKESDGDALLIGKTGKNANEAKKNGATMDNANGKKDDASSVVEPDAKKHKGAANDDMVDGESDDGKTVKPVYYVVGAVGLVAVFGGIAFAVSVFKGSAAAAAAAQSGAVSFQNAAEPMVEQDVEAGKGSPVQRQFV